MAGKVPLQELFNQILRQSTGIGISPDDHTTKAIKPLSVAHTQCYGSIGKTGASTSFPPTNGTKPLERTV